jgi:hypothetical protein
MPLEFRMPDRFKIPSQAISDIFGSDPSEELMEGLIIANEIRKLAKLVPNIGASGAE